MRLKDRMEVYRYHPGSLILRILMVLASAITVESQYVSWVIF